MTAGEAVRLLRHTSKTQCNRAHTQAQLATKAGLERRYLQLVEREQVPLLPEAAALLLAACCTSPRDEALVALTEHACRPLLEPLVAH